MQPPPQPPLAFSWADLVDRLVAERGSLAELARALQEAAAPGALSDDPLTVERGLRRLRARGNASGDKYGRALLRAFGLPGTIHDWARRMGQYHSRLGDLPVALRRDQLRLWDRPPVTESPTGAWIQIGLATLAHREQAMDRVRGRLDLAAATARRAGPDAGLELALFEARLASDARDREAAQAQLDRARALLDDAALSAHDRACYLARLQDQIAWRAARGWRRDRRRLDAALAASAAIPAEGPPFAQFRRAHGLAWCRWRMGQRDTALALAREAVLAAGDGGYLRFRCMALRLLTQILGAGDEAARLQARADRIAAALGDAKL